MRSSTKWGFIGCGNLAQALIQGLIQKNILESTQIFATDIDREKLASFAERTGVFACGSNGELASKVDFVVLVTKPQDLVPVLVEISSRLTERQTVVSLAAGVSSEILERHLKGTGGLARVMPNTPALIQKGVFGIYVIRGGGEISMQLEELFSPLGFVIPLKSDREVNAITAGAASGTGFVVHLIEIFQKWFAAQGFSPEIARQIAIETFLGATELAKTRKDRSLEELRMAVTSKKGTTEAGLTTMKKLKLEAGLRSGIQAAFRRGVEISKELEGRGPPKSLLRRRK